MSRFIFGLIALVAMIGSASAVYVTVSASNGQESVDYYMHAHMSGIVSQMEDSFAFDLSGATESIEARRDFETSERSLHGVRSVVDGHVHMVSFYKDAYANCKVVIDGDVTTVTVYNDDGTVDTFVE